MRTPGSSIFKVEPFPCALPKGVTSASIQLTVGKEALQQLESFDLKLPLNLKGAVLKRRVEYLAGRFCAFRALRQAGYRGAASLSPDPDRIPEWPVGFVGSITHGGEHISAAAATSETLISIGIDTELVVDSKTVDEVKALILTEAEEETLSGELSPPEAVTLALSAKESVFKAFHPVVRRFIDFKEVILTQLDTVRSRFKIRTVTDFSPLCGVETGFSGSWSLCGDYVHTALTLRRMGKSRPLERLPYYHA